MLPEAVARSHRRAELEVLVTCSRVELAPEDASRLAAALAADLEWEYLLRAASANGILPLLHRHLVAGGAGPVPAEVKAVLRQRLAGSAQAGLLLTAALVEALRALADTGLDAVPFKGPLLAAALYGDIGLRPFRDVDILVRPGDLAAAVDALRRIGWTVASGQGAVTTRLRSAWVSDLLLARAGALLELHWRLTPPYFGISDTLDDIADELAPAAVAGLAVRTLSPTALLFYLCVHGATHRWPRLEWICDVAELLRRHAPLDWAGLRARARANGAERMVGLGALLATELLGAPAPAELSGLIGRRTVRSLAGAVYRHLPDESADPNPGLRLAPFHLAMRERLRDTLRYAASVMFAPSPLDLEAVPLPATLYPLYYLVRPLRLAGTHARRWLAGPNPAPPP